MKNGINKRDVKIIRDRVVKGNITDKKKENWLKCYNLKGFTGK